MVFLSGGKSFLHALKTLTLVSAVAMISVLALIAVAPCCHGRIR